MKWLWFDENGNEIPNKNINTHTWYSSYRKAEKAYEKAIETLYSHREDRVVEQTGQEQGFSPHDGSYELSATKIHYNAEDKSYIRVILAAVDVL